MKNYTLYAYCIMPDHLHLLVRQIINDINPTAPAERCAGVGYENYLFQKPERVSAPAKGFNISQLIYTIKSYYIKEIREKYNINCSIWQKRFNSRIIDTEERLLNTIEYTENNPVNAGLPEKYSKFPYMYFNRKEILRLL